VRRGEIAEVCGQGNIVFRIENMQCCHLSGRKVI
jgi:hypothetical protein